MLSFDDKGLLVPYENIRSSVVELKLHFVDSITSTTRLENYNKYIDYSNELKHLLNVEYLKQWINGSFVTKISNPKDIDLVTFIDLELMIKYKSELLDFAARGANNKYGVDAYLVTTFPDGHKDSFLFDYDQAYWNAHFSKTRRDHLGKKHPKGFLENNLLTLYIWIAQRNIS